MAGAGTTRAAGAANWAVDQAATTANGASGTAAPATTTADAARAAQPSPTVHPVVLVGIPGLRWSDVSAAGTPALWRLASAG